MQNEPINLSDLRAALDAMNAKYGPEKSWADGIPTTPLAPFCANATEPAAWYCYHYGAIRTAGKEHVNDRGLCEACEVATPPYEEAPSFLSTSEE